MRVFRSIKNYILHCGLEKDEYNAIKNDVYVSNFVIWRSLHAFMTVIFGALFISSLFDIPIKINRAFYLIAFLYSATAVSFFFFLKKNSKIIRCMIYVSISFLFVLGCLITKNNPVAPATTFIGLLLITPMFIIDRPIFMTFELCAASTMLLVWMHGVKQYDVWVVDLINVIIFTVVGIFLNIIANSIRIREFVLTREINIQKDTDELTGLKNKGALTREINEFLGDSFTDKGIMFILDIDRFKAINDTFGHDVGDRVIAQLGHFLGKKFSNNEVVGRFGGDEFIVFIKDTDNMDAVTNIANEMIQGAAENVLLPDQEQKVCISIGVSIYKGLETNYYEIFKKADIALYKAKANPEKRFYVYNSLN